MFKFNLDEEKQDLLTRKDSGEDTAKPSPALEERYNHDELTLNTDFLDQNTEAQ